MLNDDVVCGEVASPPCSSPPDREARLSSPPDREARLEVTFFSDFDGKTCHFGWSGSLQTMSGMIRNEVFVDVEAVVKMSKNRVLMVWKPPDHFGDVGI